MLKRNVSVIPGLLITNIVAFMMQLIIPSFTQFFILDPQNILLKPWGLLTSMFLHSETNFNHIFFNMYGLYIFGPLLERKIGNKRFLMVYLGSGIIAALAHSLTNIHPALGASGAIMGMLGVLIVLMPDLQLLLFFFIPMKLWQAGILWAAIDIFGLFFETGIANMAHLGGLVTGLLYGYYLRKKGYAHTTRFKKKEFLSQEDIDEYFKYGGMQ